MLQKEEVSSKCTLADIISSNAIRRPEAIAFIEDGADASTKLTWREYHETSDALALFLIERGYQRGERIGIWLPDGIAVHIVFVACEKAGLVAVGVSPRAGENEIAHVLRVAGAVGLVSVCERNGQPVTTLFDQLHQRNTVLRELMLIADQTCTQVTIGADTHALTACSDTPDAIQLRRFGPQELFLINSTSGTTGMPKCVAHNQARWLCFAEYAQDSAPLSAADVFLCAVPASVGFGLWFGHFTAAILGAPTVLLPKFSVTSLLRALTAHRVTVLAAVSTQLIMLLNAIEAESLKLEHLRFLYTGGEAVPFERAARFEALTQAIVLQFYGSNEAGGLSYTRWRDSQALRLRTAGRIIPEMQVTLLDPQSGLPTNGCGRPICQGPLVSLGYANDDAANRQLYTDEGFLKVDDVVRIDDQGYLTVVGRIGDFIIRGGKNISAAAVEEAALAHPAIAAAAAVAMPDVVFGEKVCLYATLAIDAPLTLDALVGFLQGNGVSKENCPERLILLDELPQVSGGKVAKQSLREDIRRRLAAENG
jgi:acyl-CoA synthetase